MRQVLYWPNGRRRQPPPARRLLCGCRRDCIARACCKASLMPRRRPGRAANRCPPERDVLELQSLCAFRAFAELRLGSAPLDTPAPGVTPQERGQLIHAALEALWKVLKDSQSLQELSADDLNALISRSVAQAAKMRWGDLCDAGAAAREAPCGAAHRHAVRA